MFTTFDYIDTFATIVFYLGSEENHILVIFITGQYEQHGKGDLEKLTATQYQSLCSSGASTLPLASPLTLKEELLRVALLAELVELAELVATKRRRGSISTALSKELRCCNNSEQLQAK